MSQELNRHLLEKAFASRSASDAPRSDCPPAEQLWHGVRGELESRELRQIVLHLGDCPLCTEAWSMAQQLEENPEHFRETANEAHPSFRSRMVLTLQNSKRWLTIAALLLTGIVSGPIWNLFRPAFRGDAEQTLELIAEERENGLRVSWTEDGSLERSYLLRARCSGNLQEYFEVVDDLEQTSHLIPRATLAAQPEDCTRIVITLSDEDNALKTIPVDLEARRGGP